ncbi:MAG TPA: hypothetical protein VFU02_01495 [Polyangiaceae bacterium]|nr:hypothetical protein [Polyangiaceae bacterium]
MLRGGSGEFKPRRHPQRWLVWCLTLATLAIVCWAQPAHAYTWMIRHGYNGCSSCHADPSGGELLSSYGRLEGDVLLRMQYGDEADAGEEPDTGFLWGAVDTPPNLLLGGGFRNLNIYQVGAEDPFTIIPIMMGDLYGQVRADFVRVAATGGISKVKVGSPHARAAQVTHGQGEQYNMVSRTHWLGFDLGENDQYLLRLGRINLPFGVRVPEHTLWAREATRTDRESDQQHGAAFAYTGDSFRGEIMGIAGNFQVSPDKLRERGYSLFFEYFPTPDLALGASSLATFADEDRITLRRDVLRQAHGVIGRAKLTEWLAVYGEADLLLTTDTTTGYTGFAQFDIELVQGLHFMLTGEFVDQGLAGEETEFNPKSDGRGKPRFGGWASIDWFFYKQFELRLDAVQRTGADTQLLAQLHFYL